MIKSKLFAAAAAAASFATPALASRISGRDIILTDPLPLAPAVPEPAAWATMIVGFAVVGIAIRVRKAASAKA